MEESHHIFEGVEDPGKSNATRHDPHGMPRIGLLSTMRGGEGCSDMALSGHTEREFPDSFMTPRHGIASHDAFRDPFDAVDPLKLRTVPRRLVEGFADRPGDVIAVDGKAPRRSRDRAGEKSAPHPARALAPHSRLISGRVAADAKSNGITAPPALSDMPSLEGRIVTADAMHTQKATARAVSQAGGDYVGALKGDQTARHEDVPPFADDPDHARMCDAFQGVDGAHGRIETRRALISHDPDRPDARHDRPGPKAIGKVTATRGKEGKTAARTRCYPPGTPLSAERFLAVTRARRAIENGPHRVLDVTMNEDRARNRKEKGPGTLAIMRRVTPNPARAEKSKASMRGKLKKAGWHNPFMIDLIRAAFHVQKR